MPDYKGYEYAARWKGDHWEIEVYQKKPDTDAIFTGELHATEATEAGSTCAHGVARLVIDSLEHGEPLVLGEGTLSGGATLG